MDEVSLMKRQDTKYLVDFDTLVELLSELHINYKSLEIKSSKIAKYNTVYLDTKEHKFYLDHHNGRSNRYKLRIRNYVDSGIFFLETKLKNNKGVTDKNRISVNDFDVLNKEDYLNFLKPQKLTKDYIPILENSFHRITLVNTKLKERITIDLNLAFDYEGKMTSLDKIVIIEVKQERFNPNSPIVGLLKSKGFRPASMSKYCVGLALLNRGIKKNTFKKTLLNIKRIYGNVA